MKILCLYPSLISGWGSYVPHGTNESSFSDHGLMMLSAVLKNAGHQCFSMDLRSFQSWSHFEEILQQQIFDLTLVSFYSANEKFARQAVEIVKRNFPGKYIIGGGVHLSVTRTREYPNIDSIVWGEGEPHILNIVDTIASGKAPEKVYELKMIEDLGTLPYADRELFNRQVEESSPLLPGLPEPFITIVAGRGCPHLCLFCSPSRSLINGNKCRIRPVDHFLGEILKINKEKPIGSLMIHDDLLGTKKWYSELIEKWRQNLPRIPFWCQMRADSILRLKDLIPDLADIGMSYVSIGIESLSKRELEFLKKGTTPEQNYEACRLLHDNNINIFANVILGLPLQSDEDRAETSKFMHEIKPAYPAISIYTFYPGSNLHDWIIENNYLAEPEQHYSMHRFPFERKIKGQDYDKINALINEWNSQCKGPLRTYIEKPKIYMNKNDKKKPKVTIILITYHRPKMFKEALLSVINQTISNWELIIIENQGDWQMNKELYDRYSKDTRVKWIRHKENINNISYCWNEGIDLAEGEYLCTLDDDNTKYPQFLEKMCKYLDDNLDKDAVVCPMQHCGKIPKGPAMNGIFYRKPISFQHIKDQNHIDSGQIMYRKSVLDKVGLFDENMVMLEDWEFILRIYALNNFSGSAVGWLDNDGDPLCSYSWHDNKRMFDPDIKAMEDKYYGIIRGKRSDNHISLMFFQAKDITASQIQLADNIKEAIRSFPFITEITNEPDIIIILGTLYNFSEEEIANLKRHNPQAVIMALLCEDPQAISMNQKYYPFIDRVVTNDINAYDHYVKVNPPELAKKYLYWNNLSISNKLLDYIKGYNPRKKYDICLIGHAYLSRMKLMSKITRNFKGKIVLIGDEWDNRFGYDSKDVLIYPTMNEIETAKIAMQSKIILIKHRDNSDVGGFPFIQPKSVNRGYIEAAYRSILLIDIARNYHSFGNNKAVNFYKDAEDCTEKIKNLLLNYNKYQDSIESLYQLAIEKFTHKKRLMDIINCIRSSRFNKILT
jgi:radical SAM superfamily enzyme YgiQ (UPF0313 family)